MTKKSQKITPDNAAFMRLKLSSIDIITLIYTGWIMLYMLIGWGRAVKPLHHFPVYLSIFVAVWLLAWWHSNTKPQSMLFKVLSFVRGTYPVNLFGYFFVGGYVVNRIIFSAWQDPFFMEIDHAIFGYLPSIEWAQMFPQPFVNEILAFAYFAYYPMIVGLPIYLYFKKPKAFSETMFCLTCVFYICYFIYSWLPVIGGRYLPEAMELSKSAQGYVFSHIMAYIYSTSTHLGGAFPSSHVAIALTLSLAALRHVRPLGIVFAVISFFLAISTVYLHYHWFFDTIAGVITGLGGFYLALRLHRYLIRNDHV